MATKVKRDKDGKIIRTIGEQYGIILKTEELYGKRAVDAHKKGLITLSAPQLTTCEGFVGIAAVKPTQHYLHSSDNTHGKMLIPIGTNLNHGPMKQQSKSSIEVNETILQFEIIKRLHKTMTGSDKLYPYFLTPTYKNNDKGELKKQAKINDDRVGDLLKALKDGAARGNGLQLVGGKYIGGLISREITINAEKFKAKSGKEVWNDHVHILLLSDKPLNVRDTERVLWKKWKELNPEKDRVNRGAFNFKAAYDPKNPGSTDNDAIQSAVKEAIKYSTKPSDLDMLCQSSDDYSLSMFAELFEALKGAQMKRRHGLWWTAANFLSVLDEFKNAIRLTTVDEFPDIVTQLSKLVYNHAYKHYGRYESVHERELSADEVLFHNRSMIEKILVTDEVVDEIREILKDKKMKATSEMKQVYVETFKDILFCNTLDDLLEKLQSFANKAKRHNKALKAYDIELLSESMQAKYNDGCLEVDLSIYKDMVIDKRMEMYELYDDHVATVKGDSATEQNKADWAVFADKQGLNPQNINTKLKIELFAAYGWSDTQLEDYFGNAFVGRKAWDEMKEQIADEKDFAVLQERTKLIKLMARNLGKSSFGGVFPIELSVPAVELNRPKIVIRYVADIFPVLEYVSDGFELAVVGECSSHLCDDHVPTVIKIENPFL